MESEGALLCSQEAATGSCLQANRGPNTSFPSLRCIWYPNLKSSLFLLEELGFAHFSHSFGFPIRTLCAFRLSLVSHVARHYTLSRFIIIIIIYFFFFLWRCGPTLARASSFLGF